jgi:hypothetical protein
MKKTTSILLLSVMIFAACSTQHQKRSSSTPAYSQSSTRGGVDSDKSPLAQEEQRMIAYDASIDVTVKNPDTAFVQLKQIILNRKGYIVSISTTRTVFRVSADQLEPTLDEIGQLGKVENKRIWGQDVTDEYQDLTIRLDNAMKARARYLELLAKAENVQAALMVEKELERLNKEIDLLQGKIKRIEHITAYSSITVNIKEKVKPGIVGYVFVGLYKGVKWFFVRN